MLEDSQRENIDLKACACEEKPVVIMNTHRKNVNAIAELVFNTIMNGGLEVAGRSAFNTNPP